MKKQLGRIVSALVPGDWLLLSQLGRWYEKNPYHKFDEKDILILKNRGIFGYGLRPVAVVRSYELNEGEFSLEGNYEVTMHQDKAGSFDEWMRKNEIPKGVERIVKPENHFKWNIENQFRRVSVKSVEEALALYGSKEVAPAENLSSTN